MADLSRRHGVSEQSLYRWKSKYRGMDVSEAKRLLADAMLDNTALKGVLGKKVVTRRHASASKTLMKLLCNHSTTLHLVVESTIP
jgi:putative transposase